MKENTVYQPPQAEVIEVQVEQVLALSYGTNGLGEENREKDVANYSNTTATTGDKVYFLAAGYRTYKNNGSFGDRGKYGGYWSSSVYNSNAWSFRLGNQGYVNLEHYERAYGQSVRCVKD